MGPLPAPGSWARLEVPARFLGLASKTINRFEVDIANGQAWWDHVGKIACSVPANVLASSPSDDVVWVDDAVPAGGALWQWQWDTSRKATGTQSNKDTRADGLHTHQFQNATAGLAVGTNDSVLLYVYLDPCDPPREIMIALQAAGGWEHRAYWGEDLINAGTPGTPGRASMGSLPPSGQWVRLLVPASTVAVGGLTLTGINFEAYGGNVWWDHIGKVTAGTAFTITSFSDIEDVREDCRDEGDDRPRGRHR